MQRYWEDSRYMQKRNSQDLVMGSVWSTLGGRIKQICENFVGPPFGPLPHSMRRTPLYYTISSQFQSPDFCISMTPKFLVFLASALLVRSLLCLFVLLFSFQLGGSVFGFKLVSSYLTVSQTSVCTDLSLTISPHSILVG